MAGETRSVVVRLSMDTAQAIRASKEFGTEMDRAMAQAEKRTTNASHALDQLGGTAGKIGLAAAAGFVAIEATAANFDEAMSHVAATGEDARASLDELREAAIQAGQDTAFSASEAAAGIENLAKAGVSAQDILGGGLSGSLDLAAAGGLDVASASEIAATALTQFKLAGEDVPHVADLLAAAAGKAQGDVSDMSMALKQSGLVASQMGLSLEETTGTLAAFASAGLLGSDAGTSFRTMLLRLANPTVESKALMDQLGIAAYDAQGNFVGMAAVSGQLQSALQNKTQAERDSALATIFGSDAIRAASVLYGQGAAGITDWTNKVDDSGYAAETAAIRMDNLKGDIEQFMGSLETALIGAGEGSQGALRDMVQGATKAVNVFNDLPGSMQGTVTELLAITAVTGGGLWFGSKVIRSVSDTKQAIDDLGGSSSRSSRALKGLSAAGATLATLTVASAVIEEVERATTRAVPGVEALTASLIALGDEQAAQNLRSQLGDVAQAMNDLDESSIWEKLDGLADKAPLGLGNLASAASPLLSIGFDQASHDADNAAASIGRLDEALANIVTTGSADDARKAFDDLTEAYGLNESQQKELLDLLPEYQEALDGEANAATLAADASGDLTGASAELEVSQRQAQAQVEEMQAALDKQRESARETAHSFLQFGDSLDDSKVSLGEWIRSLEEQADALHNFRVNAEEAAHRGLDKGLISSLQEAGTAGALRMKQLANATDAEIDRANKAWRRGEDEMRRYVNFKVPPKKIQVDGDQAKADIHVLLAQLAELNGKHVTTYIDVVRQSLDSKREGIPRAAGGPIVGPGTKTSDSVPVMASAGEFMMSAAAVDHYGLDTMFSMNARRLAGGGSVDGKKATLDDRIEIIGLLQQIRDLRHELRADGKDAIHGLRRRAAELDLERAQRDLYRARHAEEREAREEAREKAREERQEARDKARELRQDARELAAEQAQTRGELLGSLGGLFDSIFPPAEQTKLQEVTATIDDFREQWVAAGGAWTNQMAAWAFRAEVAAQQYDLNAAALETETARRNELSQTLNEQQSQLDTLNSTMASFNASVAGNFRSDPFSRSSVVRRSPAQTALEEQLAAAQAAGDAAGASRLMQQLALAQSTGPAATGLGALRASLESDIADSEAFAAALSELALKGLDTTGPLGGLYAQLAASGDVVTASDLAALSAEQIDEYEKLFATREDAAATVGALATQAVYGEQQATLMEQVSQTTQAVAALDASIVVLEATLAVLGEQVRAGAESGAEILTPEVRAVKDAIDALPRELKSLIRQGGK